MALVIGGECAVVIGVFVSLCILYIVVIFLVYGFLGFVSLVYVMFSCFMRGE
jgi:hypothetical protein